MKSFCKTCFILFVVLIFMGCNTVGVGIQSPAPDGRNASYHKQGPPPHAPAHGYRHKHQHGHEMQYDSSIQAYVVLNIPETYFGNNLYIRMSSDGRWMVSATLDGDWRLAAGDEIPRKLKQYKENTSDDPEKGKKSKKGNKHKINKYKE
ncbi:MAG: hypothetical protein KKE62_15735 [Proteobacteria bacterium]|nr:hypothetical protein [Pseudomonadota bacterium]MBU1387299.1 hypothetical protein [Pseudomonadota bacterium]MBU1544281.1 hypothetical protein [Pseudomonadota bacterium]MBU2482993.1 hypothetical protein [Pseudomonadota bacterium]